MSVLAAPPHARTRAPRVALPLITTVMVVIVFALPMLWILLKSFGPEDEIFSAALLPSSFHPENYARAVQTGMLVSYTLSTIAISFFTCLIVLPLGFMAGYGLARFSFRGRGLVLFLFMFSLTIPGLVNLLAIYQVFSLAQLINNPAGLVIVYAASNLPLATWLMRAFIQSLPSELEQAALVDGCTRGGAILRIVVPLTSPGLAAVAVLVVVNVFQEFIVAQTLISTRGIGVVSQGLRAMQGQFDLDYTSLAAGSVLVSVIPVLLFLLLQKQFIAGMTTGATTG
ncbi:carbohydrate ABC transporter permease [Microbacterium sp. ISL-59]|uniref:carbohydrate ABC transporter permease n=1 Tax=Microbacterium sp. ISL-59 TaxID=2819159 RepID=UPI001BEACA91|nr:carbohydrate ABC transporter permease [Microbacterium sp. ISL-59]MBT2495624.1 carbohydrate ABC transporter permease [Microbacterium sp. ISL-59]